MPQSTPLDGNNGIEPHETSALLENEKSADNTIDARKAYEDRNLEASKNYHDNRHNGSTEMHQTDGGMLKSVIFGGLDGILTAFAIVAGAAGGNIDSEVVLILGFSNVFADAVAMGVGEFLSSKAENEWILHEKKREKWEMDNHPEGEINEMIDIYEERGMSRVDAALVINTMSKYPKFFVDVMMAEELGLQVPDENFIIENMKEGVVMFCSFAFFGSLPLLGYVIFPTALGVHDQHELFVVACVITGLVLFLMGCLKSSFSATHWFRAGTETLLLGGACAFFSYTISYCIDARLDREGTNEL